MMEGKNLTKVTLPAKVSFRLNTEIKSFTDKQAKRIQHHQTSFATNAKEISLGRKQNRRPIRKAPNN